MYLQVLKFNVILVLSLHLLFNTKPKSCDIYVSDNIKEYNKDVRVEKIPI